MEELRDTIRLVTEEKRQAEQRLNVSDVALQKLEAQQQANEECRAQMAGELARLTSELEDLQERNRELQQRLQQEVEDLQERNRELQQRLQQEVEDLQERNQELQQQQEQQLEQQQLRTRQLLLQQEQEQQQYNRQLLVLEQHEQQQQRTRQLLLERNQLPPAPEGQSAFQRRECTACGDNIIDLVCCARACRGLCVSCFMRALEGIGLSVRLHRGLMMFQCPMGCRDGYIHPMIVAGAMSQAGLATLQQAYPADARHAMAL